MKALSSWTLGTWTLGTWTLGCCVALSALSLASARGADLMPWCADFRTACGVAAEQQRLVLLHFSKDDCPPCRKVEAEVFSQAKVGEAVSQNYIPVHVHAAKNLDLVIKYQVKLFPTDVFVTPSGLEVYRAISPQKPAEYITLVNQVAQQTGTSSPRSWAANMNQIAQQATGNAAAKTQQTIASANAAAGQAAAGAQEQVAFGKQSWSDAVQQFRATGDQARAATQQAADQAANVTSEYKQQVVGAAEEMHQQAADAAANAQEQVAATAQQFQQQSQAASQQWQQTTQQSFDAARSAGQQAADAARGTAQTWQQSLNSVSGDLRSSFLPPGGAPAAPAAAWPAVAAAPPAVPSPSAAPASTTPPTPSISQFMVPPATAAQAPPPAASAIVSQHSPLPTENPWMTPAGRALAAQPATPAAPPTPAAPQFEVPQQQPAAPAVASSNANTAPPLAVAPPPATPPATPVAPAPAAAPPAESRPMIAASQAPPIALDGFCVVTLVDNADKMRWQKADPKFGAIHRGRTYLFASAEAQQKFLQSPDSYAPVLSGCDPVRFAKTGELVEGKRAYGLLTPDKRVFLFADEASLSIFESAPGEFAAMAYQAMLRNETGSRYR